MVSHNSAVYALSPENGALRWQFPLEADRTTTQLYAAPAQHEDFALLGSDNKRAFAVNIETGQEVWRFDATGNRGGTAPTDASASAKLLFFTTENTLHALRPSTGVPAWTFRAEEELWAAPAADDERVYLPGMDHNLTALDIETGAQLWQRELDGALADTPTLSDGVLYLGVLAKHAYAIDALSGRMKWRFDAVGWVWGSPTVSGDRVYFADLDGNVYALDTETGRILWQSTPLDSSVRGSPAFDNNAVFIATDGGFLYALDAINGDQLWGFEVDSNNADRLLASPIARDGLVFITAMNGENLVLAYEQDSGQLAWRFQPGD
jgi:outer membrane protein assembly factor BamB